MNKDYKDLQNKNPEFKLFINDKVYYVLDHVVLYGNGIKIEAICIDPSTKRIFKVTAYGSFHLEEIH